MSLICPSGFHAPTQASVVYIVTLRRRTGNGCVTLIQKDFKTEISQVRTDKKIGKVKYTKNQELHVTKRDHNKGHRL